jgi:lysozyme family protein
MANWDVCFSWLMDSEDPNRAYATVKDSCPKGIKGPCFAISGVNSGAWPAWFAAIDSAPYKEDRARMVERFYQNNFWNQWYAQLDSDDVAKRVFDMSVNGGKKTGVKLLQRACNCLSIGGLIIDEDGQWGPKTLDAVNSTYGQRGTVVDSFKNVREDYYEDLAAKNPAKAQDLKGWLARAKR